jgi:hypothetical protein
MIKEIRGGGKKISDFGLRIADLRLMEIATHSTALRVNYQASQ